MAWTDLPALVCACVLGGFALWGWWRTRATGALLIAIAAAIRVVHELPVYISLRLFPGHGDAEGDLLSLVEAAGLLVSDVLLIVGVALVLRRLPARAR